MDMNVYAIGASRNIGYFATTRLLSQCFFLCFHSIELNLEQAKEQRSPSSSETPLYLSRMKPSGGISLLAM